MIVRVVCLAAVGAWWASAVGCRASRPEDASYLSRVQSMPPYVAPADGTVPSGSSAAETWTCPMHPEVQLTGPGKCPRCGMDLVPNKPSGRNRGIGGGQGEQASGVAPQPSSGCSHCG